MPAAAIRTDEPAEHPASLVSAPMPSPASGVQSARLTVAASPPTRTSPRSSGTGMPPPDPDVPVPSDGPMSPDDDGDRRRHPAPLLDIGHRLRRRRGAGPGARATAPASARRSSWSPCRRRPRGPATANAARVAPSATVTAATTRGRDPSDGNTCSSARPGRVSPTLACRRLRRPECSVRARGIDAFATQILESASGRRVDRSGEREDEERLRDVIRHHDRRAAASSGGPRSGPRR